MPPLHRSVAHLKGLVGGEECGELEGQLRRSLPDRPDHQVLYPVGHTRTQRRLVHPDLELGPDHDPVVAGHGEHAAAGRAVAGYGGGGGEPAPVQRCPAVLEGGPEGGEAGWVGLVHLEDVQSGAEHGRLGGGEEQAAAPAGALQTPHRRLQLLQQLQVERVDGRPVELDGGDPLAVHGLGDEAAATLAKGTQQPQQGTHRSY
jgi:hypothetical protein